jgi:hypothetical protein
MTVPFRMSLLFLLILICATDSPAMTVYLNDGSEVEAESAWTEGEIVYVRVNPELSLEFSASEVNANKSGISKGVKWSPASTTAPAAGARSARPLGVLDELMEVAGHRRAFYDAFGKNDHTQIGEIFAKTFTPSLAEKSLRYTLSTRLTKRELAEVLAWHKTKLGRKIVEADSVIDFNSPEHVLSYVGNQTKPDLRERKAILSQIDRLTGNSEIETHFKKQFLLKIIQTIPEDFPDAKNIKNNLRYDLPVLETVRAQNINKSMYTFRLLTMPELHSYLQFLSSPTGRKYVAAVNQSTDGMLAKLSHNMEKEFHRDIKLLTE